MWVLTGYLRLTLTIQRHAGLIDPIMAVGVNVSMNSCLSFCDSLVTRSRCAPPLRL